MLSSRFMCVPLRPTTIHPSCRNHKPTPKQTQHKEVGGACGKGAGAKKKKKKIVFCFFISVVDVLLLRFHSHSCKRCWCSESEGTSLQTPGLDRQVPKVTTTGRSQSSCSVCPAHISASLYPKIHSQHFRVSQFVYYSHSLVYLVVYLLKACGVAPVCVRRPRRRRWRTSPRRWRCCWGHKLPSRAPGCCCCCSAGWSCRPSGWPRRRCSGAAAPAPACR